MSKQYPIAIIDSETYTANKSRPYQILNVKAKVILHKYFQYVLINSEMYNKI